MSAQPSAHAIVPPAIVGAMQAAGFQLVWIGHPPVHAERAVLVLRWRRGEQEVSVSIEGPSQ